MFLYSYEQMSAELETLQRQNPAALTVVSLGKTVQGRNIWKATVGDRAAKHHILIHAGIHGREFMNAALVMNQLRDYLETWKDEEGFSVCFHVIPMVNPDGCMQSQQGMLENNRKHALWKANAVGVDLNRNFPCGWHTYSGAQEPGAEGFKGPGPASEVETRAILQIRKEYDLACCISYHSAGNLIYWDYGCEGRLFLYEKSLAQMLSDTTGYPLHSTVSDGVDGAGCSDYFVLKCGIPAVTIETGEGSCPLEKREFACIYRANQRVWNVLIRWVMEWEKR